MNLLIVILDSYFLIVSGEMAESVCNADAAFLQLNEVLRNMNLTVNKVTNYSFTDKQVHDVHDMTLSLRDYKQRSDFILVMRYG